MATPPTLDQPTPDASVELHVNRKLRNVLAVALTSCLALVGGYVFFGVGAASAATTEHVLQVVQVGLGTDGSIKKVTRSDIAQDKNGYHADDADLEPTDVAGDLPVKVSTLYTAGDKVGTDLDKISGYKGNVRVDFNIANVTQKPQTLTVNGNSVTGLVAVPLTVVATAVIPKDSVSRIETLTTAGEDSNPGSVVTLDNGDYQVQWATILAPPALPGAATFSLGLKADGFKLDSFQVAVTPGQTADPGLKTMIDNAFGNASPLRELETNTITQINNAVGKLSDVQDSLNGLDKTLTHLSVGAGGQVTGDLAQRKQDLADAIDTLSTDLEDLNGTLGSTVTTNSGTASTQLRKVVTDVVTELGVGVDGTTSSGTVKKPTVYGKLQALQALLTGTITSAEQSLDQAPSPTPLPGAPRQTVPAGATKGARQLLQDAITQVLGTGATDTECQNLSSDKYATLTCLGLNLTRVKTTMLTEVQAGLSDEDRALYNLRMGLASVGTSLSSVVCATAAVSASTDLGIDCDSSPDRSVTGSSLAGELSDLLDPVNGLPRLLDSLDTKLGTAYSKLSALQAGDASGASSSADGAANGADTASAGAQNLQIKTAAAAAAICDVPSDDPAIQAYAQAIQDASGIECADGAPKANQPDGSLSALAATNKSLVGSLGNDIGDFQAQILSALAALNPGAGHNGTGDGGALAQALDALQGAIGSPSAGNGAGSGLYADLVKLQTAGGHADSLAAAISGLTTDLTNLGSFKTLQSLGTGRTTCVPADATPNSPSTVANAKPLDLIASLFETSCDQLNQTKADAVTSITNGVKSLTDERDQVPTAINNAAGHADDTIKAAVQSLEDKLTGAAGQFAGTTNDLKNASIDLTTRGNGAADTLDSETKDAVKQLGKDVGKATDTQQKSSTKLQSDIGTVIKTLGDSKGKGLFGLIAGGASSVGLESGKIGDTAAGQSSYVGVREAEKACAALEAAEQQAGQDLISKLPSIGRKLATADSTSSTTFIFSLDSVG